MPICPLLLQQSYFVSLQKQNSSYAMNEYSISATILHSYKYSKQHNAPMAK